MKYTAGDYDYLCFVEKKFINSKNKAIVGIAGQILTKIKEKYDKINTFFSGFKFIDASLVQEMDVIEKRL